MKFARIVYGIAAVYGFIVLPPLYFLLDTLGRQAPPPVNHPEFYYGFAGVATLWQVLFVLIASDPIRYRPIMLITVPAKLVYTVPVVILYLHGQANFKIVAPSLVDPVFAALFAAAYLVTRNAATSPKGAASSLQ
jgi:hypothetical protein